MLFRTEPEKVIENLAAIRIEIPFNNKISHVHKPERWQMEIGMEIHRKKYFAAHASFS